MKKLYIIVTIFSILFFGYFIPKAFPQNMDINQEIAQAKAQYQKDLDEDFTDMGCVLADLKYKKAINDILEKYKGQLIKEVTYDEINPDSEIEAEIELDRRAAWLDAQQFND